MYWFAAALGAAPRTLLQIELQRRVAADPHLIDTLLRVLDQDLSPSTLLHPRTASRP